MQWQYCQFSMYFFQFNQNSTIYTDLIAIRPIQWQNQPFVSCLLAEDPGPSILNIVAILPDFDGFLPILSKLNYLYRCNRHPTLKCQNLPFVSHLLGEDPREADPVQWQYCQFFIYFFQFNTKLDYSHRFRSQPTFVFHLLPTDPRTSIPSVLTILPYFFQFHQSSTIYAVLLIILPFQ